MQLSYDRLCQLEAEFGDSFYWVDVRRFQRNYEEFLAAFRQHYPASQIAYSYKTNYLPRFCQVVNQLGGYAEVVSAMEYNLARQIGVQPQQIIFNGPYKRMTDLSQALLAGSVVNLDSWYELEMVEALARRYPQQTLRLGVRCNFEIGGEGVSRFGFDVGDPDFALLFRRLRALDNCVLEGLHCHFLVPKKQPVYYARMAEAMLDLASHYFAEQPLRFLDLGGGFFSNMSSELRSQFNYPIPSFQEYAAAIAPAFARHFARKSQPPQLILEPGIALVADVVRFVAKVIDVKEIRGRHIAITSGSIYNIKPTLSTRNLPMTVVAATPSAQDARQSQTKIDITGYTCMEDDCLYHGYDGTVARGDFVIFDNVGAYTNVLKPPFINPCPAMLAISEAGDEVLKRPETGQDIFATYIY